MKTKLEIIDEVVNFYSISTERRAIGKMVGNSNQSTCYYLTSDGRRCAVGKFMKEDSAKELKNMLAGSIGILCMAKHKEIDDFLLPEYQGHSIEFWSDLQELHDFDEYWSESGLTKDGWNNVSALKRKYDKV